MKKYFQILLAISFILVVSTTKAQIKFGPKAGLNLSKMSIKAAGISLDPKTMVGFSVGAIAEITIKSNFFLQPGVFFSTKGSKYNLAGENISISPSFLELPINALYKFDLGSTKLLLYTGPYFAFGIGGTYKMQNETTDLNFGKGEDNDMKPFDFGINFGTGFEISNFQVTVQYGLGLTNLAPITSYDASMKVGVISFSMAYLIGK